MKALAVAVAVMVALAVVPQIAEGYDGADDGDSILLDTGDGWYGWYDVIPGGTLLDTVVASLAAANHSVESTDTGISSVNGIVGIDYGSAVSAWYAYGWSGDSWDTGRADMSEKYTGGDIAVMLATSGSVKPASTPLYPDTWTSYRGSQSSPGISSSNGPENAATPLEWYATYNTGNVDSSLLYADGFIYHTTTGNISAYGNDSYPHLYCVSSEDGSVVWSQRLDSDPEAVTLATPVIIGSWILVGSCTGHMYLFDRFSGDILRELVPNDDEPFIADRSITDTYTVDGLSGMEGQVVRGGVTNMAVHSGAVYFGTEDGTLRCYTVSADAGFNEVWRYVPETRGALYFHPPAVTWCDERWVVVIGSYAGLLHCVDAATGEPLEGYPISLSPGGQIYPGSVSSIVPVGDGRVLVTWKDGEMSPLSGRLSMVDMSDGSVSWTVDAVSTAPTYISGIVYVYLSPSYSGSGTILTEDGTEAELDYGYYALWAETGRMIWYHASSATVSSSAGITFADGRIYSCDYSSGMQWPFGGGVTCLDADTGNQIWRVQLEPFTNGSYSMVSPTVVDGMVLVANDYGAIYCISDTPGIAIVVTDDIEYEITGILDWSWMLLIAVTVCAFFAATRLYRGD